MILTKKIFSSFGLQAGRVFVWQKNQTPKLLNIEEKIQRAALGPNHTVLISQSGKVYSYGNNTNGQCGHGHKDKVDSPRIIEYFQKHNIKAKDAVCGEKHTLVLDQNGQIYSFGYGGKERGLIMKLFSNTTGPLGHGNIAACLKPTRIKAFDGKQIQRITCGRQFNTVIDSEGNVYNWGNGQYGAFGDGKNKNYSIPTVNEYFNYLKNEENIIINKMKSSESYSIALLSDGKLYGWGSNESGQMGVKSEIGIEIYETVNFPTEVIREGYQDRKVVNFDISENTLIFQLDNGQLWWAGMKMAYTPEKVKLHINQPKLFAAGNKCFAVVDHENNVKFFLIDYYVKGQFEEDLYTGIKKSTGQKLFGGQIVGIGGQYDWRYAIVK